MEVNSKENIKKYWDEKVDHIQGIRVKDHQNKYRQFERNVNNISLMEEKEKLLIEELKKTTLYSQKLKSEQNSESIFEEQGMSERINFMSK